MLFWPRSGRATRPLSGCVEWQIGVLSGRLVDLALASRVVILPHRSGRRLGLGRAARAFAMPIAPIFFGWYNIFVDRYRQKQCIKCNEIKYFTGSKYCDICKPIAAKEQRSAWLSARPNYHKEWEIKNPERAKEFDRKRDARKKLRRQTDPIYREKERLRDRLKYEVKTGRKVTPLVPRKIDGQLLECIECKKMLPRGRFTRVGLRSDHTWKYNCRCKPCARPAERVRAHNRDRVEGKFTIADVRALMRKQNMMCACNCGQSLHLGYHIDHIMPLARGGTNWPANLQLLTPLCNLRKAHKTLPVGVPVPRGTKHRPTTADRLRARLREVGAL